MAGLTRRKRHAQDNPEAWEVSGKKKRSSNRRDAPDVPGPSVLAAGFAAQQQPPALGIGGAEPASSAHASVNMKAPQEGGAQFGAMGGVLELALGGAPGMVQLELEEKAQAPASAQADRHDSEKVSGAGVAVDNAPAVHSERAAHLTEAAVVAGAPNEFGRLGRYLCVPASHGGSSSSNGAPAPPPPPLPVQMAGGGSSSIHAGHTGNSSMAGPGRQNTRASSGGRARSNTFESEVNAEMATEERLARLDATISTGPLATWVDSIMLFAGLLGTIIIANNVVTVIVFFVIYKNLASANADMRQVCAGVCVRACACR